KSMTVAVFVDMRSGAAPKAWHPTHGTQCTAPSWHRQDLREHCSRMSSDRDMVLPSRWADGAILGLFAVVAFCLGCYEMGDSDLWWHLSGGRWILANRRLPDLDPFTYGSADRRWVDIHWAFEVLVASLYAWRGIPATVLMAAFFGMAAFVLGISSRYRTW